MDQTHSAASERFEDAVGVKFQLYNSLFLSLPFHGIEKTGTLLSLFAQTCEEGFEKGRDPVGIVRGFFATHTSLEREQEKIDLLFRFVQYVERQIVLFDALEDATFSELHDLDGPGTLEQLERAVIAQNRRDDLAEKMRGFGVRLVLTAHPTQFYPGTVLGIINDLAAAIAENDLRQIKILLRQLGLTPFFKKQKPTPYDEAVSLIWYLENVFYHAVGGIIGELRRTFPDAAQSASDLVRMGFWPGGDRDGNPFVEADTTLRVASALKTAVLRSYHGDVRRLKRRLTFSGVEEPLAELEARLYEEAYRSEGAGSLTAGEILSALEDIRGTILAEHRGLFVWMVDELIGKVASFGLHFASLDIRQDSSVHARIWEQIEALDDVLPEGFSELPEEERIETVLALEDDLDPDRFDDELTRDTFRNLRVVKEIQQKNGERGCHRYIISHTQNAFDVAAVLGLFLLKGWKKEELAVDIVPLFETVEDLRNAAAVMRRLYQNETYREHLRRRNDTQTIMLGFSDGTKDGGYLMANYGIYRAKDELTRVSREHGIRVVFFDGRGGPPARGGGKTHKFYASMGGNISDRAIELTVQGQTVSSNFGTVQAARYNIEQLLNAGMYNDLFAPREETFTEKEEETMKELAAVSFEAYSELKNDPAFLAYLENVSPLKYYARTNIGSRPAKRGGASQKLSLDTLRAIPFVGAWSQMKQNVPGFYGVGTALRALDEQGKLEEATELHRRNRFFRALIDNCEMAMQKSFFPLTAHLRDDPEYGRLWRKIYAEFELTAEYLNVITERTGYMHDFPVARDSVRMRERIVLPLTTIQQYALARLRSDAGDLTEAYEKLVVRCSFGIINAGRNSA